jgi:hypothetical protein
MGVAYDCFWYWRYEFNGQADPYSDQNNPTNQSGISVIHNASASHVPWSVDSLGSEAVLADRISADDRNEGDFFPSWEWPGDYTFL